VRVSDLNKRPVMDLSSATTVGRVDDVIIDPATRQLVGFELAKTPGKASYLAWDKLRALGADAVTIEDVDALTAEPDTMAPPLKRGKVMGGIVLTDQGYSLGNLSDVEFDAATGSVTGMVIDGDRVLPGESLLGIGHYAMVVTSPADAPG
jgi:sporulation protein YlmC with PRC-barrel domain